MILIRSLTTHLVFSIGSRINAVFFKQMAVVCFCPAIAFIHNLFWVSVIFNTTIKGRSDILSMALAHETWV